MKINITTADKVYSQALALTLARCLHADVVVDGGKDYPADFFLCDDSSLYSGKGEMIVVSKFEPVSKLVDRLRFSALSEEGIKPVNIRTLAVTGMGGSGVSTISRIFARIASEIFERKVALLSFDPLFGPSERQVYELLTAGKLDPRWMYKDESGVLHLQGSFESLTHNPLGRLSRKDAVQFLENLGRIPGLDLIVMDVPFASSHWSLCMKASEKILALESDDWGRTMPLLARETAGLSQILYFENRRQQGKPDMLSETGAALRSFVQEIVC